MTSGIDALWLQDLLVDFLRTPTEVPAGATEVKPGDRRILDAIDTTLIPRIEEMAPDEVRRHRLGDFGARFGPAGDDGVLVLTYVVSQHANLMRDAHSGRIVDGDEIGLDGPCAIGQGATQNKGPLASVFSAVKSVRSELRRPVWLGVNTEGQSSHGGSARILDDLDISASAGIVAIGTDQKISIGNRGRADVDITIKGKSAHSSQPTLGANPIEAAADVILALRDVILPGEHPDLGPAAVTPYQLACGPIAPHTLPEYCRIVVDRRLLPGETPERAVEDIQASMGALSSVEMPISVELGKWMLPSLLDPGEPIVRALQSAVEEIRGESQVTMLSRNTFDAGYACHKGIPTPMFGPGRRHFSGEKMLGLDAVSLQDCVESAAIFRHALLALCS